MNKHILILASKLLDQLHGVNAADAFEVLECVRRLVEKQARATLVDKDHDINDDLAAFGITREQIGE